MERRVRNGGEQREWGKDNKRYEMGDQRGKGRDASGEVKGTRGRQREGRKVEERDRGER